MKEERKRRSINDCVSESDNYSEDAYSMDDRSESRSSSINRNDRRRMMENLSKSREKKKVRDKEV